MSTITHWKFLPHLQPQRESFQVLFNREDLLWNWVSSGPLPTQPIPCFILDIGYCDPTGSKWGLCEFSAGIQPPSGSRRPNTTTPRNPHSISLIFLKDSYVLSLMPRSLEHKQLCPFPSNDPILHVWRLQHQVFSLDGTDFSKFFQCFAIVNKWVFFPLKHPHIDTDLNMCFPPCFPISLPQIHFSLLLLKEFLWLSVALLAITSLFAEFKLQFKAWLRSNHKVESQVSLWGILDTYSLHWQSK